MLVLLLKPDSGLGHHIVLFLYFLMHAVQGDRGLLAWLQIRQQIASADIEYKLSKSQRNQWEHRIGLLRRDGMNSDMLDDRVRIVTGFVNKNDLLIIPLYDHDR